MKKLSLILVLVMSIVIANAQPKAPARTKSNNVPVKITDLPKAITENVAKDFAGFSIKDANLVEREGVSHYIVDISKGATTETLVYDKDGKFIKKSESKSGMPMMKPAANTTAKPAAKTNARPVAKTPPKK
jgi:hypothetical protein